MCDFLSNFYKAFGKSLSRYFSSFYVRRKGRKEFPFLIKAELSLIHMILSHKCKKKHEFMQFKNTSGNVHECLLIPNHLTCI